MYVNYDNSFHYLYNVNYGNMVAKLLSFGIYCSIVFFLLNGFVKPMDIRAMIEKELLTFVTFIFIHILIISHFFDV